MDAVRFDAPPRAPMPLQEAQSRKLVEDQRSVPSFSRCTFPALPSPIIAFDISSYFSPFAQEDLGPPFLYQLIAEAANKSEDCRDCIRNATAATCYTLPPLRQANATLPSRTHLLTAAALVSAQSLPSFSTSRRVFCSGVRSRRGPIVLSARLSVMPQGVALAPVPDPASSFLPVPFEHTRGASTPTSA